MAGGISTSFPRDGATQRCVTPGEYDVIKVIHVDEKAGWVYFYASPENPTQHYLYRTSLSGTGKSERLSPADQPGWHDYDISSDGGLAVHTFSSFGKPPRVELITLPDHKVIRSLATNDKLRDVLKQLEQTPAEFLRTDIGNGIKLDGWMIKPPNFNSRGNIHSCFMSMVNPGSNRHRPLGWQPVSLAPDAGSAGICRGLYRQPRNALPTWP